MVMEIVTAQRTIVGPLLGRLFFLNFKEFKKTPQEAFSESKLSSIEVIGLAIQVQSLSPQHRLVLYFLSLKRNCQPSSSKECLPP